MTHVILVRHGQTDWNRDRIFRGQADVPLNEAGREEARKIGAALKDVEIAVAYSSPLSRATGKGNKHGIPVMGLKVFGKHGRESMEQWGSIWGCRIRGVRQG